MNELLQLINSVGSIRGKIRNGLRRPGGTSQGPRITPPEGLPNTPGIVGRIPRPQAPRVPKDITLIVAENLPESETSMRNRSEKNWQRSVDKAIEEARRVADKVRSQVESTRPPVAVDTKRKTDEPSGPCDCDAQLSRDGRNCGRRSARVRSGGKDPDCGVDPIAIGDFIGGEAGLAARKANRLRGTVAQQKARLEQKLKKQVKRIAILEDLALELEKLRADPGPGKSGKPSKFQRAKDLIAAVERISKSAGFSTNIPVNY